MDHIDSIGQRIAQYRKLRGWSQRELANRVGYSISQVEKIERGVRAVERYSTLHAFARTLAVDVSELTGDPGRVRKSREHSAIPQLRRVLTSSHPEDGPVRTESSLRREVAAAIAERQRGKYMRFAEDLPTLLDELQRAINHPSVHDGISHSHGNGLYAELAHGAGILLRRLGYVDLAWIATQRARLAAEQSDDELLLVANDWHLSELCMRTGNVSEALRLADNGIYQLNKIMTEGDTTPQTLSLIGTFHLIRSMVAAQRGERREVDLALNTATAVAKRNVVNRDDYQSVFGPSNVALFGVATALELGDSETAVIRARVIEIDRIPSRERQTRFLIDFARAYAQTGAYGAALRILTEAQKRSSAYLLHHVMARELVAQLLEHERRSITPGLRTLAKQMDIE